VRGGPRLKFVSFLIYQQAIQLRDWSRAASMAVLLLVVTTGVLGLASAYGQIAVWRRARRNRIAAPLLATSGREEAA
jgi:ABC-type spermidine/putrescine transport system permease subunit I